MICFLRSSPNENLPVCVFDVFEIVWFRVVHRNRQLFVKRDWFAILRMASQSHLSSDLLLEEQHQPQQPLTGSRHPVTHPDIASSMLNRFLEPENIATIDRGFNTITSVTYHEEMNLQLELGMATEYNKINKKDYNNNIYTEKETYVHSCSTLRTYVQYQFYLFTFSVNIDLAVKLIDFIFILKFK